jgi:CheY-like chemotaxis protein
MFEQLALTGNALIAVAYGAIAVPIAVPVVRGGRLRTSRLAASTALIFGAGVVWYGFQAMASLRATLGTTSTFGIGSASTGWWTGPTAVWDVFTLCVGIYYLTTRRGSGWLLGQRSTAGRAESEPDVAELRGLLHEAEQARDEALAQSRVKSESMTTMSRELRTPLNGVIGLASLLLGTDLDPGPRRYAAGVHSAGNSLLGVVNDIPLAPAQQLAPAAESSSASPVTASSAPGPRRVLLVEDDEINQMVAVGLLTSLGYQPDVAKDGIEALDLAAMHDYDAVLMDCRMPRMDGFSATAELRSLEENGHRTPIIAMTASALEDDRVRCLAAGMDDYLAKPVDRAQLASTLGRWT